MIKEIIQIWIGQNFMLIQESEVNMKQYKNNEEDDIKYEIRRLDSKTTLKRKYKLIIEELCQYESDSPKEIQEIINSYVNYS